MSSKSRIVGVLAVCCLFLCYCQIGTVNAVDPTVYIQADGSVQGTDNITRNGDVYIFNGDAIGSLFVAKSNIIIDGAGYTLQGSNAENSKSLQRVQRQGQNKKSCSQRL